MCIGKINCNGSCNSCHNDCQPTNMSNRTIVTGQVGADAYKLWLSNYPNLDPDINPSSPWTEKYWVDNWAKGEKGDKGDGVQIKGSVPTYADLATITPAPIIGDTWAVDADGMLYTYGTNGFPAQGQGIQLQGADGDTYVPIPENEFFDQ